MTGAPFCIQQIIRNGLLLRATHGFDHHAVDIRIVDKFSQLFASRPFTPDDGIHSGVITGCPPCLNLFTSLEKCRLRTVYCETAGVVVA